MLKTQGNRLVRTAYGETLWLEPWGENAIRVRATRAADMPERDWALLPPESANGDISIEGDTARLRVGRIEARITRFGEVSFWRADGALLLREYNRNRNDLSADNASSLDVCARELRPVLGGDWSLTARFESDPDEKLYGMGQYQQPYLNVKGCEFELAQRNSQASVPFLLSNKGYGLLWHNPAVGRASFARNLTTWQARSTDALDYWITSGDTPAEIVEAYSEATGYAPMMPEYAMGFWQCKLRYQTRDELMAVVRGYKERGLPLSVIVVDFFHWPCQGEWRFDERFWPDPAGMVRELREMGVELLVSVWPTVDEKSQNYKEMRERGLLIQADRGVPVSMLFMGNTLHVDVTNPEARAYFWQKAKENYYDKGVRMFWLDEAEPEYAYYDFDLYRYHLGPNVRVGNVYPQLYARAFCDGMRAEGQENPINLVRCAWAGSQRYGALVWSGDIHSSFASMRNQLCAGLNMGLCGIPWWTTDIGGFLGGDTRDPAFHELLVRWFEWGAYCPVMRLHGDRLPGTPPLTPGESGGGALGSGGPNEVWRFGEENYEIFKKYLFEREAMKPYVARLMREAHTRGTPVMRALFYEFPNDPRAWEVEDAYLFGDKLLVAPVLEAGVTERKAYLPKGANWREKATGIRYEGGQTVSAYAPLDIIPVFERQ